MVAKSQAHDVDVEATITEITSCATAVKSSALLPNEKLVASSPPQTAPRFDELDALRGICTCIVVTGHFWFAFGGPVPIPGLINASLLSVCVFFVLSGYVIAYSYLLEGKTRTLLSAGFRRLPRLLMPAACANLLAWMLRALGAFGSEQQWRKLSGSTWCDTCMPSTLTPLSAVSSSYELMWSFGYGPYYFPWQWTIGHEIFGSIIVFMLAPFVRWFVQFRIAGFDELVHMGKFCWPLQLQRCIIVHSVCMVSLFTAGKGLEMWLKSLAYAAVPEDADPDPMLWGIAAQVQSQTRTAFFFVGGLALAQTSIVLRAPSRGGFCWSDMLRAKWGEMYLTKWVLPMSLIAFPIAVPLFFECVDNHICYRPHDWFRHIRPVLEMCGALSLLAGVLCSPPEFRAQLAKLSWLGRLSFGIYLLHMLVVFSIGLPLYVWLDHRVSHHLTMALLIALCAGPLMFSAHLFWLAVEEPIAMRLPRQTFALLWDIVTKRALPHAKAGLRHPTVQRLPVPASVSDALRSLLT